MTVFAHPLLEGAAVNGAGLSQLCPRRRRKGESACRRDRAGRFTVWWDRELIGGAEYSREIDDALKAADIIVVLWSNESIGSAWVRDEAAAGRDTGRLIPVRIDGCEPPLGFRQYQTIDLSGWNGRSDTAGVKTLKKHIAVKLGRKSTPETAEDSPPRIASSLPKHPPTAWLVGLAILLAAVAGYFWYARQASAEAPTIAFVSAPSGADRARSEAMARNLSVDVGGMQSGASNAFELRDASGSTSDDVDYLVQVAASPITSTVSADLSLLDGKGRQIIWTAHFEKPAAEQADLRPQAATQLQAVLACLAEASRSSELLDQPTLKLFLRGCEKFADAEGGLLDEDQLSLLRQVADRAPRFAPAIAHLALIEALAGRLEQARALIAKAKTIDPTLPKIYLAESELLLRSNWQGRQAALLEGLRVNPDAASLHAALAFEYGQVGLRTDAIASALRAVELDPASPFIRMNYIQVLTSSGRFAEAEAELLKAEKIWPNSAMVRSARWAFDLRVGDAKRALNMLNQDEKLGDFAYTGTRIQEGPMMRAFLEARINPTQANIQKSIELHRAKVRLEPHLPGTMLLALAIFGRVDEAYAVLAHPDAIASTRQSTGLFFRSFFKKFRQDPRFMPLAAKLGLVGYWKETGKWPDFCFEPDLPYDCKKEAAKYR